MKITQAQKLKTHVLKLLMLINCALDPVFVGGIADVQDYSWFLKRSMVTKHQEAIKHTIFHQSSTRVTLQTKTIVCNIVLHKVTTSTAHNNTDV